MSDPPHPRSQAINIIRALMPKTTKSSASGIPDGVPNVTESFAYLKEIRSKNASKLSRSSQSVLRGNRSGLSLHESVVAKDRDGKHNIGSFWASARVSQVGNMTPASSTAASTPGSFPDSTPGATPPQHIEDMSSNGNCDMLEYSNFKSTSEETHVPKGVVAGRKLDYIPVNFGSIARTTSVGHADEEGFNFAAPSPSIPALIKKRSPDFIFSNLEESMSAGVASNPSKQTSTQSLEISNVDKSVLSKNVKPKIDGKLNIVIPEKGSNKSPIGHDVVIKDQETKKSATSIQKRRASKKVTRSTDFLKDTEKKSNLIGEVQRKMSHLEKGVQREHHDSHETMEIAFDTSVNNNEDDRQSVSFPEGMSVQSYEDLSKNSLQENMRNNEELDIGKLSLAAPPNDSEFYDNNKDVSSLDVSDSDFNSETLKPSLNTKNENKNNLRKSSKIPKQTFETKQMKKPNKKSKVREIPESSDSPDFADNEEKHNTQNLNSLRENATTKQGKKHATPSPKTAISPTDNFQSEYQFTLSDSSDFNMHGNFDNLSEPEEVHNSPKIGEANGKRKDSNNAFPDKKKHPSLTDHDKDNSETEMEFSIVSPIKKKVKKRSKQVLSTPSEGSIDFDNIIDNENSFQISEPKSRKKIVPPKKSKKKFERKMEEISTVSDISTPLARRPRFTEIQDITVKRNATPGVRRSGRNRMQPLDWWRSEREVYQNTGPAGSVPEVIGVERGGITPKPTRFKRKPMESKPPRTLNTKKTKDSYNATNELAPMPLSELPALPRGGRYMRMEETCLVFNVDEDQEEERHIIFRNERLYFQNLELSEDAHGGAEPCQAARMFVTSGAAACGLSSWSTGALTLPPNGIKEAERVGNHTQLYWIMGCRPLALELAIGKAGTEGGSAQEFDPVTAQRYLLSPGDHFFIPPSNLYRLENHSKDVAAQIVWTILNPPTAG